MIRWLRSIFAWETRRDTGVWLYQENTVTGERRITRISRCGYQPCDFGWLRQGNFGAPPLAVENFRSSQPLERE
ncbi:MAG: hypothetical protein ACK5VI_03980 [Opitutia bacterium]|jgi:hypothetical protein